jgi:hypothetical protein
MGPYNFSAGGHDVRRSWIISAALCAGCVDSFDGANVQIDLGPRTPGQAPPSRMPLPTELPSAIHFRLYAVDAAGGRTELQKFELHKLVDPTSPCFIDLDAPGVPFPGLHVTQYERKMSERTGISDVANPPPGATMEQQIEQATAVQRMRNVTAYASATAPRVVTSASPGVYPDVDPDCTGTGLPPPVCIDEASNARRLQICSARWAADKDLFEGTDRVLTSPLNGTTFGFVIGLNPVPPPPVQVPVGGAQFVVPVPLDNGVAQYAIYFQPDTGPEPGTLFLSGSPTSGATRGVTHVHMDSPFLPGVVTAELAIFIDIGEDDVHF